MAWSADGQWLAAAGHSGGVRRRLPETARTPRLARESDNGQNVSLTWHPTKTLLAVGSNGGRVWIRAVAVEWERTFEVGNSSMTAAWLADNESMAIGGREFIDVWDTANVEWSDSVSTDNSTFCMIALHDGRSLLCGQQEGPSI